jgi:hypothetical protein
VHIWAACAKGQLIYQVGIATVNETKCKMEGQSKMKTLATDKSRSSYSNLDALLTPT